MCTGPADTGSIWLSDDLPVVTLVETLCDKHTCRFKCPNMVPIQNLICLIRYY